MKQITKIEKPNSLPKIERLTRVAAYARVSTDEEKQLHSLEAQTEYYTNYISAHPGWSFAGIYADNGISGLSYHQREQFKRLIADCEDGRIDMIVTKSISRFARNTVDTLNVVRRLKAIGIGVLFEKENIWSLDGKGEFVLTLMSSFAQEESRSISENTTWGVRRSFAKGNYSVPYGGFLGYGKGFVIEEDGAYVVRLIYKYFIQGLTPYTISRILQEDGYPTPRDGTHIWSGTVVSSILTNEKYKGDALTQKTFRVDYLSKKRLPNNGEIVRHYITGGHEAIIPPEVFDYVQETIKNRLSQGRYSGVSRLSSKLICGRCGHIFGPNPIHSTDKYRHTLWQCRDRFKKGAPCHNRHFRDEEMPDVLSVVLGTILKCYPDICTSLLATLQSIVGTARAEVIVGFLHGRSFSTGVDDENDWSFIIERIVVFDTSLEVHLLGDITITIQR